MFLISLGRDRRPYRFRAGIATLFVAAAVGCGATPAVMEAPKPLTEEELQLHLESFEQVWRTVHERHYDPTFGGLDWEAIGREYRPLVEQADSADDVRRAITSMLARLELSHFGLIAADTIEALREAELEANGDESDESTPGTTVGDDSPNKPRNRDGKGRPGLDLRVLDGRALVTWLDPDGPAAKAGIRLGWEIVEIDGRKIDGMIQTVAEAYRSDGLRHYHLRGSILRRLNGDPGDEVEVRFTRQGDTIEDRTLRLYPSPGTYSRLGQIAEYVNFESCEVTPGIGYIRFNMFLGPELLTAFSSAIESFRDSDFRGVIIDLRGNPGGVGFFANAMAGWFFEYGEHEVEDLRLGRMFSRDPRQGLIFAITPRVDHYPGKLAVLIDSCSASTSEIMAGGLRDIGRARLFGRRTAGAALPSTIETLPNGDGFQFAIANYVSSNGAILEGVGVEPHEFVELSRDALLEGTDGVIHAAIQWIEEKTQE